jgi:hypothetical protein
MKNIKYIKFILISLLVANGFTACENVDFGDKNANVNGSADPYTAGLMSGAIMDFATYTGRDGLMKPTLYVQYQSQVTYVDEMLYAAVNASWYQYYVRSLSSMQQVIDYCSDPANVTPALESQGSVNNQIGVASILKCMMFKRVTDTYGDVPFSTALEGVDNLSPTYDTQENVYKGIISDLKTGRDMLNSNENWPTGDIIYGGDVDKWKKFANSFIMQTAIQLSKKYPGAADYAATEFNSAMNNGSGIISTVADEAWFSFEDVPGFRNPWNANRTPDYFMSKEFSDALQGITGDVNPTSNHTLDTRIDVYATGRGDGVPYGYKSGSGAGAISISNDNYWNNTTPLPLLTASYTYLNRADAANMGWTGENVANMLTEGIAKSYETLDSHFGTDISGDAAAYAAARVADMGTAPGGSAQVIGEEKWVSLFGQAFDAWSEWRRTDYPKLTPAADYFNDGKIPRRYIYPSEEATLNGTNYQAGLSGLSPANDENTAKVWWDQ